MGKYNFVDGQTLFYHKNTDNTPGTAGGPGGLDQTLAVKSQKII